MVKLPSVPHPVGVEIGIIILYQLEHEISESRVIVPPWSSLLEERIPLLGSSQKREGDKVNVVKHFEYLCHDIEHVSLLVGTDDHFQGTLRIDLVCDFQNHPEIQYQVAADPDAAWLNTPSRRQKLG